MGVSLSKFASLENGGGKFVKNGGCQEFLAKSQENTEFSLGVFMVFDK